MEKKFKPFEIKEIVNINYQYDDYLNNLELIKSNFEIEDEKKDSENNVALKNNNNNNKNKNLV